MHILDTHLHLIYPDRLTYEWLENAPAINKPWSVESYFAEAEGLGISQALHMEVDVAESDMLAETDFIRTLDPRVVGAIASARPEYEDFPQFLEKLIALGNVKGVRRILHEVPDELSATPLFEENLRHLGQANLPFDLCIRNDQFAIAKRLVDAAPDTQFVLDHCANPNVENEVLDPWRGDIAELAKRPNVAGKISGIVNHGGAEWTAESLRPYVEHMIESFGWSRVVWGSDHPVCTLTADLTRWVNATKSIIANSDEQDQAKLLHKNAQRIYKV